MRTLTLIRKTVSPADPPVTLPCPPPKEAKAPSGQGAGQSGFSGPVPPMPQGPGELARYRLGGEGWVDLRQHQPGRRCGPGASWHQRYRDSVCGPREEPLFLTGWEMKWAENAAHTHLVKLLEEQGRVGLRP